MKKQIKKIFLYALRIFPIRNNKVFFCNFAGKGYGGNPKYIAEQIKKENLKFDMVWMSGSLKNEFPQYIRTVKPRSLRCYYELATSKVIISNVRVNLGMIKRNNQIYLQTWHGPFSAKCVEKDAINQLLPQYVEDAKNDGKISDGIIVNSFTQEEQFKRAFWLEEHVEFLRYGLPRNDFLLQNSNNTKLVITLRKKMKFNENDYIILYAPTFRDDYSIEGYKLDYKRIIDSFKKITKKECRMVVRLHPNVQSQRGFISYNDEIIDGTMFSDIQELALLSDCIISDYSSTVFDFAILNKPVFICALDLDEYKKKRGLQKEFNEFPFPMAKTNDEMINNILSFDKTEYNLKVNYYFKKYPYYDKGHAAKDTVAWIKRKIND